MEFAYQARDKTGARTNGIIEAPNEQGALKMLRDREVTVIKLSEKNKNFTSGLRINSISLHDRMIFTQELSLMIRAGIPLARCLNDLEEQTSNSALRNVLHQIAIDIRGGTAFSDALRKHPEAFSPLMIAMIHSGEASGKLVEVLERLALQMEKDADLRGKLQGALIYPLVLTVGIITVMIIVVLFVVPQLQKIFLDVGVELPLLTRILLTIADIVRNYGIIILLALISSIVGVFLLIRQPGPGLFFDKWKIRVPLFGMLSQKIAIARFAATGASLLEAGIPLIDALRISQEVMGNRFFQNEINRVSRAAESGKPLAQTIKSGKILPVMVSNLIAVGEESGNLDTTFKTIATFYDREVESTTRNLTTLLEPALMVAMGVGIGFLVAAVLMPIYQLVQAL